jgi:hypothetical protein
MMGGRHAVRRTGLFVAGLFTLALMGCTTQPQEPLHLGDPFPAQTPTAEAHNWRVLTYWHVLAVKCPFDGLPVEMLAMAVNERAPIGVFDPHRFDDAETAGRARAAAALATDREAACKAAKDAVEAEFPAWMKAVEDNEQAHDAEMDRFAHRKAP